MHCCWSYGSTHAGDAHDRHACHNVAVGRHVHSSVRTCAYRPQSAHKQLLQQWSSTSSHLNWQGSTSPTTLLRQCRSCGCRLHYPAGSPGAGQQRQAVRRHKTHSKSHPLVQAMQLQHDSSTSRPSASKSSSLGRCHHRRHHHGSSSSKLLARQPQHLHSLPSRRPPQAMQHPQLLWLQATLVSVLANGSHCGRRSSQDSRRPMTLPRPVHQLLAHKPSA